MGEAQDEEEDWPDWRLASVWPALKLADPRRCQWHRSVKFECRTVKWVKLTVSFSCVSEQVNREVSNGRIEDATLNAAY